MKIACKQNRKFLTDIKFRIFNVGTNFQIKYRLLGIFSFAQIKSYKFKYCVLEKMKQKHFHFEIKTRSFFGTQRCDKVTN